MKIFDVFGFGCMEIGDVRNEVQNILEIIFNERDSTYIPSPYYHFGKIGGEEITIQINYDEYEDEWTDEECKEHVTLMYINNSLRSDELKSIIVTGLKNATHLRRDTV